VVASSGVDRADSYNVLPCVCAGLVPLGIPTAYAAAAYGGRSYPLAGLPGYYIPGLSVWLYPCVTLQSQQREKHDKNEHFGHFSAYYRRTVST